MEADFASGLASRRPGGLYTIRTYGDGKRAVSWSCASLLN